MNQESLETLLSDNVLVIRGDVDQKFTSERTLNIKKEDVSATKKGTPEKKD